MSRFLLRDGNPIGADISPAGLDVFTYEDAKGRAIHALASVKSEKELISRIPAKLLPLTSAWRCQRPKRLHEVPRG